jgi:hypothetical protein
MTIMEERARTLAGEVQYAARPDGGTRVALIFRPTSRVDANRAHRAQHAHSVQTLRRLEA